MRSIGIRAENGSVQWAVVEGTVDEPVLVEDDKFSPPKTYEIGDAAVWVQNRIGDIVDRLSPDVANIRVAETFLQKKPNPTQQNGILFRARFEGMAILSLAAKGVAVNIGQIAQMKARVGSKHVKTYLEQRELRGMDLSSVPKIRQEAVLAAVAALGEHQ